MNTPTAAIPEPPIEASAGSCAVPGGLLPPGFGGRVTRALDWLAGRVVLFRVGELVFVTFGLFAALGAFVALLGAGVILIGQGLPPASLLAMAWVGSVAVVGGSWLLGQILDWRLLLADPAAALRRPVFVSWGGAVCVPAIAWVFAGRAGLEPLVVLDAVARTLALGHALGRLGCLSYGCCFGRPTRGSIAITYRDPRAKAVRIAHLHDVRLHPAALYEAVMDLGIFAAVNGAAFAGAGVGIPSALAFLLYGAGRFFIEFLKDNEGRMIAGRLALNHFLSLGWAVVGILLLRASADLQLAAPVVAWGRGIATMQGLIPETLPPLALVFVGFALHRRDVGLW